MRTSLRIHFLLVIALAALLPQVAAAADFATEIRNGVPIFTKDGKPFSGWIFGGQLAHLVEKQFNYTSKVMPAIKLSYDIGGVRVYSFSCYSTFYWYDPNVKPEDRYKDADTIIDAILKLAPNAYIIPRVQLQPTPWWVKTHPDDLIRNADGTAPKLWRNLPDADVFSPAYLETAKKEVIELIHHLEERYPNNMFGYQIAGQATGEWMYWGGHRGDFFSYSPVSQKAFKEFVRKKYGTENALRKAWNNPVITFQTVTIPTPTDFSGDAQKPIREPATDQYVLDYMTFINDGLADFVLELVKTARKEVGRKRIIGIFFGETLDTCAIPNGSGWIGQNSIRRVLNSPDVDFLAAPYSYKDRGVMGHGTTMSLAESVTLAGKLWLNEDDTTTELVLRGNWPGFGDRAKSFEETNAFMRRNISFNLQRNSVFWWLDLMGGGWWNNPKQWEIMKSFRDVETRVNNDPVLYAPPVAFVFDPDVMRFMTARFPTPIVPFNHEINQPLFNGAKGPAAVTHGKTLHFQHARFHELHADYGQYLLDDVIAGKVNQSKLNLYFGLYALNKTQRKALAQLRQQKSCVWGFGSGWIDLETGRGSLEAVEELTGFRVRHASNNATQMAFTTPAARKKYGLPETFGDAIRVEPLLTPEIKNGDEIIATYADGEPAVVFRTVNGTTQVFYGVSEIPHAIYREIGRRLNLPPTVEPYTHAYKTKHFCTVYPLETRTYTIHHGFPKGAVNMVTGEKVSDGPTAVMKLKKLDVVTLIPAK